MLLTRKIFFSKIRHVLMEPSNIKIRPITNRNTHAFRFPKLGMLNLPPVCCCVAVNCLNNVNIKRSSIKTIELFQEIF